MIQIIKRDLDKDVLNLPGSGAAGGMGGGMAAFFNSTLQPGIETVLDTVHFNHFCRKFFRAFESAPRLAR